MKTKKLLFAVLFIVMVGDGYGQAPPWAWAKSAGGSDADDVSYIATDAAGNVYVFGDFYSSSIVFGSYTFTNKGYGDIFLVKYDPNGNVIWAKSAGGTGDDLSSCIAIDNTGNIYISGSFQGPTLTFGSTTLTNLNPPNEDVFLVKYDSSGNVIWAKSAGGNSVDDGSGIAIDAGGNVFMTGEFHSLSITFGSTTLINNTIDQNSDMFIVKYDINGNVVWAKSAGGNDQDYTGGALIDTAGNVYVIGGFNSASMVFGSTTLLNDTNDRSEDIFLTKYDSNGNVVWAKSAGGSMDDGIGGVAMDAHGNIYVTGGFYSPTISFGATTLTNNDPGNSVDILIAKYDKNGNPIWARCPTGITDAYGFGIATDTSGNSFITGGFNSPTITFGTTILTNDTTDGTADIYIAKYDSSGNSVWAKGIGGNDEDGGFAITLDKSENVYTAGIFSSSTIKFGNVILTNNGTNTSEDIFVAKIGTTVGIDELFSNNNSLFIYPNPTHNIITVAFNVLEKAQNTTLHLSDLTGRIILEKTFSAVAGENKIELDVSRVAKGVYFLNTVGHDGFESEVVKIIIN